MASGERGVNLKGPLVELTRRVGQQTLAVFLTGLVLAQALGMLFDQIGRNWVTVPLVNLLGCALLLASAIVVHWFKRTPWRGAPG